MNIYRRILRMADGADGGAGAVAGGTPPLNDFVKSLPVDLQAEKSLHNMTDTATLAKGFVHAQKLIGAKRIEAPLPTWGDNEYNGFYEAIGRPKTAADYSIPKIEGAPEIKADNPAWQKTAAALHKAGLTQKQAEVVLGRYFEDQVDVAKTAQTVAANKKVEAETALKAEWGDKYEVNVDLAKAVVTKFGDADLMSYINDSGGNDPRLIKTLARLGASMMEDKSRGGSAADGLQVTDATRANQEINRLKMDKDFQAALTKKDHPGHAAAVQQWTNLFKVSSPKGTVGAS